MSLPENVKKIRRLKNLTQQQLAQKVGYSYHTISRIERGMWNGSMKVVIDLANFFKVKPEELDESLAGEIQDSVDTGTETIAELPNFKDYDKAFIIDTIAPLIEKPKVREEIASRLTGVMSTPRFRQNSEPVSDTDLKCRIMEIVMGLRSTERLEEILHFSVLISEHEKKI